LRPRPDGVDHEVHCGGEVARVVERGQQVRDRGRVRVHLGGQRLVLDLPRPQVGAAGVGVKGGERGVQGGVGEDEVREGGLLLISVVILARSGHSFTAPLHATGGAGGFSGLLGITFATAVSGFVGWANSAGLAEEIRNPRRVIPIAVLSSIAVVAALYLVSTWSAVSGYAHWLGPVKGMARLGNLTNAAPASSLTGSTSSSCPASRRRRTGSGSTSPPSPCSPWPGRSSSCDAWAAPLTP